jgi:hypothetical protein
MIVRIFILFFLRVFISIVTTIIISTVITRIVQVTTFSIRRRINMCRRCLIICHGCWWNHNVPISVCLQHGAIVQLRLLQWLFLHLSLFRIFFFGFLLNFLWIFLHFSLWLKLLWFLLNIL